jgi:hypothetical protein
VGSAHQKMLVHAMDPELVDVDIRKIIIKGRFEIKRK